MSWTRFNEIIIPGSFNEIGKPNARNNHQSRSIEFVKNYE